MAEKQMTTWLSYFLDEIDMDCEEALLEVTKDAIRARAHMADFIRFQNRSAGQVRRFELAKLHKGELK